MTSQFPLFKSILGLTRETDTDLSKEEKTTLVEEIKKLDKNPQELLYGLIKSFDINQGDPSPVGLPFKGKKLKSGPKFNLEEMPSRLQHILKKFIEKHKEAEEESKNNP